MPVVTSHIIGTMALTIFAATLTVYLYIVICNENMSLASSKLQTITDYTAVRAVELISMANMTNTQSCIQSFLDLPMSITSGGYWISISGANGYVVTATTNTPPFISVESMIPLNSTSVNVQIVSTQGLLVDGVTVEPKVYGGDADAVIWAKRIGNAIQIGLGRRL
jgi:uncharacterized membrane protein